jgi:hypothetical protein
MNECSSGKGNEGSNEGDEIHINNSLGIVIKNIDMENIKIKDNQNEICKINNNNMITVNTASLDHEKRG